MEGILWGIYSSCRNPAWLLRKVLIRNYFLSYNNIFVARGNDLTARRDSFASQKMCRNTIKYQKPVYDVVIGSNYCVLWGFPSRYISFPIHFDLTSPHSLLDIVDIQWKRLRFIKILGACSNFSLLWFRSANLKDL